MPGYRALLFRRSFADLNLPGALMDRAREWLGGTAARWNAHDHIWSFPSGASLTFGYLETENDKYRYQSLGAAVHRLRRAHPVRRVAVHSTSSAACGA